jgi:hypothetical protein
LKISQKPTTKHFYNIPTALFSGKTKLQKSKMAAKNQNGAKWRFLTKNDWNATYQANYWHSLDAIHEI